MRQLLTAATPLTLRLPAFKRVALTLVGCGGTGSHLASGLAALAGALREQGIAIELLFIDPDCVESKNVGRQLFGLAEVGKPKAEVLAHRLNAALGETIGAMGRAINESDVCPSQSRPDTLYLVVGAVDNPAARAVIAQAVKRAAGKLWWLDCGNEQHSGQVALGNCAEAKQLQGAVGLGLIDRWPAPQVQYPDLIKTPKAKRTAAQAACAALTASGEQGLMVNRMVAAWALTLLDDFLVRRDARWMGLAFGLAWGGTRAYTLDMPTLVEVTGLTDKALQAPKKLKASRR